MYISYNEECRISEMILNKKTMEEISKELRIDINDLESYIEEKKMLISRLKSILRIFNTNKTLH